MKKYLLFFLCVSLISLAQPRISAHRGNTGRAPENTLATYKNALKLRVNFIEIDVRTSANGKLIILHDGTLNRTTTGEGPVKNQVFSELKKLSAGKGHAGFEKEKIPSLEEVCELISRWNKWHSKKTFIYVDCKEVAPKPLAEILQKYGLANESCFYGNDPFLLSLKKEFPQARLMPSLRKKEEIATKIATLHPYAFDANFLSLTSEMVEEIHAADIRVFTDLLGPLDIETNYKKAAELGLDLIQTDKPALVLKTLNR
ncbi:glycerophosphodiester phosphodiesterase family protein [Aquirufa sp. A-Brett2-W8]